MVTSLRRYSFAVVLAGIATLSPTANAENDKNNKSNNMDASLALVDKCADDNTETDDAQRRDALEHYNRGAVFYEQGDYESAVDEFVAAYCDAPHPQMFFNIGQSFERLLDFEVAIAYFERFIAESAPGAANLKRARVRVRVLGRLPARIRVATVPAGAQVNVRRAQGLSASGKANESEPILVDGGTYTLDVSAPGYQDVSQEVTLAIGQPYSYYFQLDRKKGVLRVDVEPRSSRIFIDDRLVGLGSYRETVDIGRYRVRVEAPKREPISREVIVNPDRTTDETFRLPAPESTGRWQLITAGGAMGLFSGAAALGNLDVGDDVATLLLFGGLGIGVGAGLVAVPRDIPISRTSFIVTSAVVGGLELGFGSALFLCDPDAESDQTNCNGSAILGAATGGMLGGVVFGAVTASRFNLDGGDAAILNSGMLWGTITGLMFYASFDANKELLVPLALAGLNLGVVSAGTLASRVDISRRRAALIDLGGVGGAIVGFAVASALEAKDERVAHSALLGTGLGLISATLLTRFIDDPDDSIGLVTPTTGSVRDSEGSRHITFGAAMKF